MTPAHSPRPVLHVWPDRVAVLLHRVHQGLSQRSRLQAEPTLSGIRRDEPFIRFPICCSAGGHKDGSSRASWDCTRRWPIRTPSLALKSAKLYFINRIKYRKIKVTIH
uniref:(northern house mosquito) hypothetical protein n=1 Tax=Culex pipiens TaxID=7175 RepID=A0A8D8FXC4_CULPI